MRVKGGNDHISYVRQLLFGTMKEKKFFNYNLKIVTDFKNLNQLMYQKEKEVQLVRMAAGYVWDWGSKKNKSTILKFRESDNNGTIVQ